MSFGRTTELSMRRPVLSNAAAPRCWCAFAAAVEIENNRQEGDTLMDTDKLNTFVGKMLGDLGGALSVPLVRIGDRLGLYKTLQAEGPMTADALAMKAEIAERYAREWLSHQ